MILQALAAHYEDLARRGQADRPGWGPAKVSFALVLSETGELLQVVSLKTEQQMGKKLVTAPRLMAVPMPEIRTAGVKANFLCDNAGYLLGVDGKGKPERTRECFLAARDRHLQLLEGVDSPAARAVCAFFTRWDPAAAGAVPVLAQDLEELKQGGNLVFQYGPYFVHQDPAVRARWQADYDRAGEGDAQICLVTGERSVPVSLHPSIRGFPGAQSSGAALVSFNAPSLESYGHEQGANSPTSRQAAFAYGTALNSLIADREHRQSYGDTTVVFWAEGGDPAYQDLLNAALFGDGAETGVTDSQLKGIFAALAQGRPADFSGVTLRPDQHFYILGLSPNAARLSVRFFWQDDFGPLMAHINKHYQQLEIIRPKNDPHGQLPLWALLRETVNQKSTDKAPSPKLTGEVLRAILTGERYPASLLSAVTLRIRADHQIGRGRAAILKAYYSRNRDERCPEEVLCVELDPNHPPQNIPFTLGRLFSVLEAIQQSANPGINATIKDKYFNSASATPATIFPILVNLAQKHLRKLDKGFAIHWEKQLTDLAALVGDHYPARLSLPEQGAFQLGYYHQTQLRYAGNKKEEH